MNTVTCTVCGESWDTDTAGYAEASESIVMRGQCIACDGIETAHLLDILTTP